MNKPQKTPHRAIIVAALVGLAAAGLSNLYRPTEKGKLYFAPGLNPRTAIIEVLNSAKTQIRGFGYDYTSPEITAACCAAKQRGVDEEWIIDSTALSAKGCTAAQLVAAGIPVFSDSNEPIFHDKVIVVDGSIVEFGSYNYSREAERNAECAFVKTDPEKAQQFLANWLLHQSHSQAWSVAP
jgi:phosphatidylserine/phosphatidylglycerophosphate/cardiolipin synthase-like enzyme